MNRRILIALLAVGSFICPAVAQKVALKTNLLYDATSTMNLGFNLAFPKMDLGCIRQLQPVDIFQEQEVAALACSTRS